MWNQKYVLNIGDIVLFDLIYLCYHELIYTKSKFFKKLW